MKISTDISKFSGSFIALEGIDGSGKSTQVKKLMNRFTNEGMDCYSTMEPTDSPIGSLLRDILMGRIKTNNKVIAPMFAADRLDHLLNETNGIYQKVKNNTIVITDRYYFSSYAYQSVDVPLDWVITVNKESAKLLRPTVNVFIDIDPETAMDRITKNRAHQELFETKSRLLQVRDKYFEAFEILKDVEKVIIVNGCQSEEDVSNEIWKSLNEIELY